MNARYFQRQFLGAQPGIKASTIQIKTVTQAALSFFYVSLSGGS